MASDSKENMKRKNEDTIAESLNNTAPFKTIIAHIEQSRKKGQSLASFVGYTIRQKYKTNELYSYSDFMIPSQPRNRFSQDYDGGLSSGYFEQFSHRSLLPWMITALHNTLRTDPVSGLLYKTGDWRTACKNYKMEYTKKKKRMPIKEVKEGVFFGPRFLTQLAAHIEHKPDPFFDDTYNWYYSGKGNMHVVSLDGADYLMYSEFNCLCVSPFYIDNLSIDYGDTATFKSDSNIYETVHSQNIIALRTRLKVIILKVSIHEHEIKLEKLKEMESEMPFTSMTFDLYHKNILYVTTLDYNLTIVNIDRMRGRSKKLRGKFSSLVDNWSSVVGAERGCFMHVTNKALTLYDKRTNEPYQRWKSQKFLSDVETCSRITAAKYLEGKPLLYLATNHHLFLMDMRCDHTRKNNMTAVQRWSHGMMSSPTFMAIRNADTKYNKEMVCLSSQWFEDMCVVSNYSDTVTRRGEISGVAMPYRPPSILQTYLEAQRKQLCCSLYQPIRNRLCTCITGLSVVDQEDNFSILMQNSLGDISSHTLYPQHMLTYIDDDGPERLHEWARACKQTNEKTEVSYIIDVKPLWQELKQVPNDYILGRNLVIEHKEKFNANEIYETYAKEELDPAILEIWKDPEEEISLDKTSGQFCVDT